MSILYLFYLFAISILGTATAFILLPNSRKYLKILTGPAVGIIANTSLTLIISLVLGFNLTSISLSVMLYLLLILLIIVIARRSDGHRTDEAISNLSLRENPPAGGDRSNLLSNITGRLLHFVRNDKSFKSLFIIHYSLFINIWPLILIYLTIGTYAIYIFSTQVLSPSQYGLLTGTGGLYGDTAMHTAYTMGLVEQELPPTNPLFAGKELTYPFLVNLSSAILVKLSASLQLAFIVPQIVFFIAFTALFYAVARKFTNNFGVFLAMLIFFLGWGLGFTQYIQDITANHVFNITKEYTNNLPGFNMHNPLTGLIFPERSFLPGLVIGLLITYLVIARRSDRHLTDEAISNLSLRGNPPAGGDRSNLLSNITRGLLRFVRNDRKNFFKLRLPAEALAKAVTSNFELITIGLLLGLLPLWHTHTFIFMGFCVFFWLLFGNFNNNYCHSGGRRPIESQNIQKKMLSLQPSLTWLRSSMTKNKFFILHSVFNILFVYGIAFLVALPQLLWLKSNLNHQSFLHTAWGWMNENTNIFSFWWKNTGLLIPLSLIGIVTMSLRARRAWQSQNQDNEIASSSRYFGTPRNDKALFFLPVFLMFLIANIVMFQPWDWDNIKIFTWVFLFLAIPVGHFLSQLMCHSGANPALRDAAIESKKDPIAHFVRSRMTKYPFIILYSLIFILVFASLTFSGTLSLINQTRETYTVYDNQDLNLVSWIKANTSPVDIFMIDPWPNQPVALTGRSAYLGYPGHLWVHGIDYSKRENQTTRVLAGEIEALAELEIPVDYLVAETRFKNRFADHPQLSPVFENQKFAVYQINYLKNSKSY